jgi:hypothetical protein
VDKARTKNMRGRLRVAVVLGVCLIAILALPALASASGLTFMSEYPVGTPHSVSFVGVDVFGAGLNASSAGISIDGVAKTTAVSKSSASGQWTSTEIQDPVTGQWKIHWTWTTVVGQTNEATLICDSSGLANGLHNVVATVKDTAGATYTDSWSFTLTAQPPVTPPPTPASSVNMCVNCHTNVNPPATMPAKYAVDYSVDNAMGPNCISCHTGNLTPAHTTIATYFNSSTIAGLGVHANEVSYINSSTSKPCVACHGNDLLGVATKSGSTYIVPNIGGTLEHNGCSCHTYGEVEKISACEDCHNGPYGVIHGWAIATGAYNSTLMTASGHNTTTYGVIGGKSKFDGSQGVTLQWNAIATSSTVIAPYSTALGVSSITTATGNVTVGTVNTTWSLPTIGVFWAANDPLAPSTAKTGLGWNSVITCEDCHTGLNANEAVGPHGGAAFTMSGIDPNYPGAYQYAELTKYIPGIAAPNPAWPVGNANRNVALSNSGIAMFPGAATHADVTSTSVNATSGIAGWVVGTTANANRTDGTTGATAVICAKCHKLEVPIAGVATGANSAHNSHHQDQLDGTTQCVNCHIGLPHGWKHPRLLVNTDVDVAPYLSPYALGTNKTTSTSTKLGFKLGVTTGSNITIPANIKPFGSGWGAGFNGEGMQYLSATDQHTLDANGMALWTANGVSSCEACGESSGHAHEGDHLAVIK